MGDGKLNDREMEKLRQVVREGIREGLKPLEEACRALEEIAALASRTAKALRERKP